MGDERTERFISFRHKELKKDGTKADPVRVVDAAGQPWNGDLIGNGSTVDVKFVVRKYPGKKDGVYIRAVRVLELVKYVAQEFAPLTDDDKFFAAPDENDPFPVSTETEPTVEDDLNDDIP